MGVSGFVNSSVNGISERKAFYRLHGALEGTVDVLETSLPATKQVGRRTRTLVPLSPAILSTMHLACNQYDAFPADLGAKSASTPAPAARPITK